MIARCFIRASSFLVMIVALEGTWGSANSQMEYMLPLNAGISLAAGRGSENTHDSF